jgi:hypothetical protein
MTVLALIATSVPNSLPGLESLAASLIESDPATKA